MWLWSFRCYISTHFSGTFSILYHLVSFAVTNAAKNRTNKYCDICDVITKYYIAESYVCIHESHPGLPSWEFGCHFGKLLSYIMPGCCIERIHIAEICPECIWWWDHFCQLNIILLPFGSTRVILHEYKPKLIHPIRYVAIPINIR